MVGEAACGADLDVRSKQNCSWPSKLCSAVEEIMLTKHAFFLWPIPLCMQLPGNCGHKACRNSKLCSPPRSNNVVDGSKSARRRALAHFFCVCV